MLHTSLLAASDVFAMFLGLTTAYAVRLRNPATPAHPISFESFAGIAAAESPLWLTTFGLLGLYTREGRRLVGHISRIIVGAAFGVAALIILNYLQLTQPLFPSRAVAVFGFLYGTAFVLSFRAMLRLAIHFAYSRGFALHRVVILGSNDIAIRLIRAMSRRGTGYDVVAVVSAERDGRQVAGIPVFSEIEAARPRGRRTDRRDRAG